MAKPNVHHHAPVLVRLIHMIVQGSIPNPRWKALPFNVIWAPCYSKLSVTSQCPMATIDPTLPPTPPFGVHRNIFWPKQVQPCTVFQIQSSAHFHSLYSPPHQLLMQWPITHNSSEANSHAQGQSRTDLNVHWHVSSCCGAFSPYSLAQS